MNKLITILVWFVSLSVFAQVTNLGSPKSWEINNKQKIQPIAIPAFDLQKVMAEDVINDKVPQKPYRVGIPTKLNYNLQNSGVWMTLENGDRIWRINLSSKDALHLSLVFENLYLPEGTSLYLYSNDKKDVQGAYTSINNNSEKTLGSWFVKGDSVWVEYFEPKEVANQGSLTISSIVHVYRLGKEHQYTKNTKLNQSGDCNHDVDCSVGADFDATKDIVKHSIAFLSMNNGYICSGGLVNNTSNDKTPYFLTANHCYEDPNGVASNPAAYAMRFNWITSGTPRCGVTTASSDGPTNQVMNGSTLRALNTTSDFMLVEINNTIPNTWNIELAGWDRSDASPTFEVGIHHPSGDIMKVCRDDTGAIKTTTSGIPIWVIGGTSFGSGNGWEIGVTEGGSSGSPLFDQNGRVIGQLWFGQAACTGTVDNNDYDVYGRLNASWNGGGTSSTRLSDWLDPIGTGAMTTNTVSATASAQDLTLNNLNVYPNPTKGVLTVELTDDSANYTFTVLDILGKELLNGNLNTTIDISTLSPNVYFLKIQNKQNNTFIVKKIVLQK